MPPKKKGNKKSSDKTKTNDAKSSGTGAEETLTEFDKEYYRTLIRDLEQRLQRYQLKCDELELEQRDFSASYNNLEKEKRDIVRFLKRTIAEKEDNETELKEQLLELQQAKDAERESFDRQLAQLNQEFQEKKDHLSSENVVLASKLAALEEFRLQKEEMMENLAAAKDQLEKEKQQHQAVIYDLEKKAVLDNNRFKKEMQDHVAAVAAEFRHVSDKKMPETTMRALHENVSVTAQLRSMSERSRQLMLENQALREREKQLRRELEVLEPLLKETTKKSVSNQRVIQLLTEKCRQRQAELEECEGSKKQHLQLQKDHDALQQQLNGLRQKLIAVREESQQKCAEADCLRAERERDKARRGQLESVLREAAAALKQAMQEVPKEEDFEVETVIYQSQLMQKLLSVLDSAALLEDGLDLPETTPVLKNKTRKDPERPSVQSSQVGINKNLYRYKEGDLGLVPRPGRAQAPAQLKPGRTRVDTRFSTSSMVLQRALLSPSSSSSLLGGSKILYSRRMEFVDFLKDVPCSLPLPPHDLHQHMQFKNKTNEMELHI